MSVTDDSKRPYLVATLLISILEKEKLSFVQLYFIKIGIFIETVILKKVYL